jgi:hypothetical protein
LFFLTYNLRRTLALPLSRSVVYPIAGIDEMEYLGSGGAVEKDFLHGLPLGVSKSTKNRNHDESETVKCR